MIKDLRVSLKCRQDEAKTLQSNELSVQEEKVRTLNLRQERLVETISEIEVLSSKTNALMEEHHHIVIEIQNIEPKIETQAQNVRSAEQSHVDAIEAMKKVRDDQNVVLEKQQQNDLIEKNEVKATVGGKLQIFKEKEEIATEISKLHEKYAEEETKIKKDKDNISSFVMKQESELSSKKAELDDVETLKKKSKEKEESGINSARTEIATINDLICKVEEASKAEEERFIETFGNREEEMKSNFEHMKHERMFNTQQERFKLEVLKRSAVLLEKAQQKEKEHRKEAEQRMKEVNKLKKVVHQNEAQLLALIPAPVSIQSKLTKESQELDIENKTLEHSEEKKKNESECVAASQQEKILGQHVTESLNQDSQSSRRTKASLSQNSSTQTSTKSKKDKIPSKPSRRSNRKRN